MHTPHHKSASKSRIFFDDCLNIFTDASIDRINQITTDGGAGAIAISGVLGKEKEVDHEYQYIMSCTNNQAELTAILLGVDIAVRNQNEYRRINLFSDSQYSINSLRYWIFGWIKSAGGFKSIESLLRLTTNSGTPVKNLQLIYDIINRICMINPNTCPFNIYHCKGHASNNPKLVKQSFEKHNKIVIGMEDAVALGKYNDKIDKNTRNVLSHSLKAPQTSVCPFAILPWGNMLKYSRTIGSRDF